MEKKLYLISGIPYKVVKYSKEFREDLHIHKGKNKKIYAEISLTKFEAFIAKIQILKYNMTHPYKMSIMKKQPKRFRV